jgi:coenzyme F420-reducing hydrogenase beta subunit
MIRNPEGRSFIEHAISHGRLTTSEDVDIAAIEKLAQAKMKRNTPG